MKCFRYHVSTKGRPVLIVDVQAETEQGAELVLRVHPDVLPYKRGKHQVTAELMAVFAIVERAPSSCATTAEARKGMDEIVRGLAQLIDAHLPKNAALGFTIFLGDLEPDRGGYMAYISSMDRASMVRVIEEWLAHQRAAEGPSS